MSSLIAKIVSLDVEPHPNADRLDLCKPRGTSWVCVSQRGLYKTGDEAIYLPIDSVLPEKMIEDLGIGKYYHKRLKTVKLRNQISQGMIAPLSLLPPGFVGEVGADVTKTLGITKYEPPPPPANFSGIQLPQDDRFQKYTNIENVKNFPNAFQPGERIVITEKLHGSNFRCAKIEGQLLVGSHNCNLKDDPNNLYWRAARILNVAEKLQDNEQLFAEIYGSGVQELVYGKKNGEISVGIFDFMRSGKYLDYNDYVSEMTTRGWFEFLIPVIAFDKWNPDIPKLADGKSLIDPTQIREGVVIKPITERYSGELHGRTILKSISDEYLAGKDRSEFH
jgi:RNA ligase (TIGR02306 family)